MTESMTAPIRLYMSMSLDDVRPPAPHRLYQATASKHWVLYPERHPVDGRRVRDHRMPVAGRDLVVRRE